MLAASPFRRPGRQNLPSGSSMVRFRAQRRERRTLGRFHDFRARCLGWGCNCGISTSPRGLVSCAWVTVQWSSGAVMRSRIHSECVPVTSFSRGVRLYRRCPWKRQCSRARENYGAKCVFFTVCARLYLMRATNLQVPRGRNSKAFGAHRRPPSTVRDGAMDTASRVQRKAAKRRGRGDGHFVGRQTTGIPKRHNEEAKTRRGAELQQARDHERGSSRKHGNDTLKYLP